MNLAAVTSVNSSAGDLLLPQRRFASASNEIAAHDSRSYGEDTVSISSAQPKQREALRSIDDALALAGLLRGGIIERNFSSLDAHSTSDRDGLGELLAQ